MKSSSSKNQEFIQELTLQLSSVSLIAGIGFAIAAILKFKAHKGGGIAVEDEQLLNKLWSSISENEKAELTNLGINFDTLVNSIIQLEDMDTESIVGLFKGLKKVGLE